MIKKSLSGIHFNFRSANFEMVTVIQNAHGQLSLDLHGIISSIKMANVCVCGAAAIATVKQTFRLIAEWKPDIITKLLSESYHS